MSNLDAIAEAFRREFADWEIALPPENLRQRLLGFIQKDGWLVQYVFGKNRYGEYLDYYASHRMTSDSHVRLYDNGRRQPLASIADGYFSSDDAEEEKRLRAAYFRRNRRIARSLAAKGFGKSTINMFLRSDDVSHT